MSKGSKKFVFKTKDGITLKIQAGKQEDAILKLARLVKSVSDWPYIKIYKEK